MSNEKGFTLIELLAALVLFSLITISAVSVTAQALQQNDKAERTNSLRNDAAYFTQVLRTAFENGTLNGTCFKNDTFESDTINLSLTEGNYVGNLNFSYLGEEESPDCFNSQTEIQTLQVNFTISNQEDETFVVDTAFTKPTADDLIVTISQPAPPPTNPDNGGGDDGKDEEEPGEPTTPDEGEENPEIPDENTTPDTEEPEEPYKPEEPSEPTTEIPDGCDFYGDTKLADSQFGEWKYCPIINIHQGSLWIPMSTSIFIQFNIDHNFYVTGDLVGQQNAVINTKDDSFVKNNVNFHSQNVFTGRNLTAGGTFILDTKSSVQLKGSLQTGGTTEFRANTKVTTGDNLTLGGNTTIQENAKVSVINAFLLHGNLQLTSNPNVIIQGNSMIAGTYNSENNSYVDISKNFSIEKSLTLKGKSTLNIKGDATIKDSYVSQDNAYLEIGKNLTISKNSTLNGSAFLYIKGDAYLNGDVQIQKNAKLIADGDIHIKGEISPDWGGGTICAKGDITMDQPYTGHELTILPNNQKCQK